MNMSAKNAIPIVVILAIIAILPAYIQFVEQSGSVIYRGDLFEDYYTGFLTAIILGLLIVIWPISSEHKIPLSYIWIAKVFIVLFGMLFYEYKYGSSGGLDSFAYYRTSLHGEFLLEGFVHGNGKQNIINMARFFQEFVPNSYHAMKVAWAYCGLIGIYLIFLATKKIYTDESNRVLYFIGLFPSILFWSSILGKDPIVFLGMGLYILGVVGFYAERKLHFLVFIFLGIFLCSFIRSWYAIILSLPLAVLLMRMPLSVPYRLLVTVILAYGLILSADMFSSTFRIDSLAQLVATADSISQAWAGEGQSGLVIEGGLGTVSATVGFLPLGMFTALFRPLPGEILSAFGLLASLENAVVLWLLFLSIKRTRLVELSHPIILWAVVLVIVWSAFYSVASYQNMGSASRFKLQILPVLVLLLAYLSRPRLHHETSEGDSSP